MTLYDKYQQRQKSSFSSAQNKTPEAAFAARNAQTTSGSFSRLKRLGSSNISSETAIQRLQRREETPVRQNWYAGEQPTGNETLARIYDISQSDPAQGQALYASYGQYMNDPSSPYYAPYSKPTSSAVQQLAALGYGTENGIDAKFFEEHSYLMNHYRTGASGKPLAPANGSSHEQDAAYYFYNAFGDYETTQKAETEWAAVQEEIAFWAGRSDLNLSYDEIVGNYIDWGKYPTLKRMDEGRLMGTPLELTKPVGYSQDAMQGVYWAARNDGGTGSPIIDGVNYARGVGNVYVEDPKISARLNPGSEDYHPYVFGTTLNDAAVYFGVSSFPPEWTEANRDRILSGTDETAKEYYYKVMDAEETTRKAEEEYAALMDYVNYMTEKHPGNDVWLNENLLDDYPTLKKLDEGRKNGNLPALTRSIDYRWEDVETMSLQRSAAYNAAPVLSEFVKGAVEKLGQPPAVTALSQQGIDEVRDQMLLMSSPTIMAVGNEAEKRVFSTISSSRFNDYAGVLSNAINSEGIVLPTESNGLYSSADAFAADNYMGAVEVIAPYQQAVAERDSAQADLDSMMSMGRDLTEEEAARAQELQGIIGDRTSYIEANQAQYDEAMATAQDVASRYSITNRLVAALGLDAPEGYIPTTDLIDYAYRYGSAYEPTKWGAYTLYDTAITEGSTYEAVADVARSEIDAAQRDVDMCNAAIDELEQRGVWLDVGMVQNLQRRRDKRQRDIEDSQYFLLRENDDFLSKADEARQAVLADPRPIAHAPLTLLIAGAPFNQTLFASPYIQEQNLNVNNMTDEEKNTYMYLYATDPEAATDYYNHLADDTYGVLSVRGTEKTVEATEELTRDNAVGANLFSVVTGLLQFEGVAYAGISFITGQEINPYNSAFASTHISSTVNAVSKEMIDETFADTPWLAALANLGYDAVYSVANSMTSAAAYGPLSPVMMGVNAAAGTLVEAKKNGASDLEAVTYAGIVAGAEVLTEKISFGNIEEIFKGKPLTIKKFLANAAEEGGTEMISSFVSSVADTVIMGEASEWAKSVDAYMAEGMSREDAWRQATFDMVKNILYEGVVGAVSGGGQTVISHLGGLIANRGKSDTTADTNASAPDQSQLAADRGNEPNPNQNLAVGAPVQGAEGEAQIEQAAETGSVQKTERESSVENETSDAKPDQRQDMEMAGESEESAFRGYPAYPSGDPASEQPAPRRAMARPVAYYDSDESQNQLTSEPYGAGYPNLDEMRKRLYASVRVLDAANESPRRTNKAAAVVAVLAPESFADETMRRTAEAAVSHLFERFGDDGAMHIMRGVMIGAAEAGASEYEMASAVITAAFQQGETPAVLDAMVRGNNFTADSVVEMVETARRDWNNPAVIAAINQSSFETRIAQREMELVSEGALAGVKSYEAAYDQARANLRTAQQNLATAQAELETAGQNLVTVQSQWVEKPSDAMRQGAVQQATKDVEGKVIVRNQQEQSVAKYEAQKTEAESMLKSQRERAMKPIREQAQQEVAAEVEAENQQKAERAVVAERKRQSDNTLALDADAFIEARYPNATEAQKQKIRETFGQTAQKKPAEVSEDNYAFASALARRFGVQVRFTDSKGAYEGAYTPDGEILLDRNATQGEAIRRVLLHELTHRAEDGQSYNELADALLAAVYNGNEPAMNADMQSIANRYNALNLSKSDIRAELVADAAGKVLDNEATIKRLVSDKPSVAHRLWESLKNFVNRLRGVNDPEVERIRKAERLFAKALDAVGDNATSDRTKYSASKEQVNLTRKEWGMFYGKISEIKNGLAPAFHPAADGGYIFAIENKLVYTDGEWYTPSVYRVIEIKLDNETEIDLVRSYIFASEDGEYSYEQARRISESVLGADVVVRNDYGVRRPVQQSDRKRAGSRNGTGTGGDRGQIPRKKNLYSLPNGNLLEREIEAWREQHVSPDPVANEGRKERQFAAVTGQDAEVVPDWLKRNLLDEDDQHFYAPDTADAQIQRSWTRLRKEGYDKMRERIVNVGAPTAEDITDAQLLMALAIREDDIITQMDVMHWYNTTGTTQGQAMQARKRIAKMTPTGMRIWVTGHYENELHDYIRRNKRMFSRIRQDASRVADKLDLFDRRDLKKALSSGEDIVVAPSTTNRWHAPLNEHQMAIIKHYNLDKVSRPGSHYNRATIKQRMLEAIIATPDATAVTGQGLTLVERLEMMKRGRSVITQADINYIVDNMALYAANGDVREGDIALARAYEAFGNISPATAREKRRAWRYTSMLLSVPSAARNVIGNAAMAGVNATADRAAVAIDSFVSQFTGERSRANLTMKEQADGWHAWVDETVNTWKDFYSDKTNTSPSRNKFDTDARGRVFQNPLAESLRNIEGFLMSVGDRNFWKRAFVNSVAEQQRVAAMNNQEFDVDAATEQAIEDANYATYAESNAISNALGLMKQTPILGDILDFVIPFSKVPVNIAKRMYQYSPAGLAGSAIKHAWRGMSGRDFDQRTFVTEMARGVTGTALFAVGMALGSIGFIKLGTGEEEDKKAYGVGTALGHQYSPYIQIGDQYISLSMLAPAVTPLIMGATAYDIFKKDEDVWSAIYNATIASMDQLLDASYMSGLQDIFGGYGSVSENVINTVVTNAISQNVPAILGQIATTLDPYVRDTYDSNFIMQALKAGLIQRIPGLRELLPEKVDVAGQTVPSKGAWSLIDPTTRTVASDDPALNEMLRLSEVMRSKGLDDSSHLPSDALSGSKNTLTGVAQPLSDEDKETYKKRYGELWRNGGETYDANGNRVVIDGVNTLIQSEAYQRMSDIDKQEAISGMVSTAKSGATYEMGLELGFEESVPNEEPTVRAYRPRYARLEGIAGSDELTAAYARTGDATFIPTGIGREFTRSGVDYSLNDEEYDKLWTLYIPHLEKRLVKIDWRLPDDELAVAVASAYSSAASAAKDDYVKGVTR